jgi:hypothetical protein
MLPGGGTELQNVEEALPLLVVVDSGRLQARGWREVRGQAVRVADD